MFAHQSYCAVVLVAEKRVAARTHMAAVALTVVVVATQAVAAVAEMDTADSYYSLLYLCFLWV